MDDIFCMTLVYSFLNETLGHHQDLFQRKPYLTYKCYRLFYRPDPSRMIDN